MCALFVPAFKAMVSKEIALRLNDSCGARSLTQTVDELQRRRQNRNSVTCRYSL